MTIDYSRAYLPGLLHIRRDLSGPSVLSSTLYKVWKVCLAIILVPSAAARRGFAWREQFSVFVASINLMLQNYGDLFIIPLFCWLLTVPKTRQFSATTTTTTWQLGNQITAFLVVDNNTIPASVSQLFRVATIATGSNINFVQFKTNKEFSI